MTPPAALTPGALDEIERLEKAATPGLWKVDYKDHGGGEEEFIVTDHKGDNSETEYIDHIVIGAGWYDGPHLMCRENDGNLIAALRNAAPALIASARELGTLKAKLEAVRQPRCGCEICGMKGDCMCPADESVYTMALAAAMDERNAAIAERDALAAKLGEAERERDALKDEIEREHGLYAQIREAEQAANVAMHERDAAMADLAKAREELEAYSSQCDTPAADAGEFWRDLVDVEKERDAALAKLAALEARAADARTMAWYLSERATSVSSAALAAARRYLDAPAAPAKADDCAACAKASRKTDGTECLLHGPIAQRRREQNAPPPLAAQLAEARRLLRDNVLRDSDWREARDALFAAIDAGRARAKETK